MTKSTKSHLRWLSSLLKNTLRVHELVAQVMRGKCVRHGGKAKVVSFALSATSYYHACEHITRKNRADSCTHCLHARIIRLAGINTYAKHVCRRRRDWRSAPQSVKFPNVHNLFTNKSARSIVILHKIWYNTDTSMTNALHAI